jgi:transposase
MLQPVVRRTWAPRGHTPVLRQWDRHDRLSVVSAISVSPQRQRLGLCWEAHRDNIRTEQMLDFLRALRRRHSHGHILILDRWSVHLAAVRRLLERSNSRLQVEWLPGHAPDLNPVEQVWNHAKYTDLPNQTPEDIDELESLVHGSIAQTRSESQLLRSFFRTAKLKL